MKPGDGLLPSRLLFVADASHAPQGLPALVARAAAAGLDFLEIRRKSSAGTARRVAEARACLAAAPAATVLVNDRIDVALAAAAHGAHVGQDDLPVEDARRLLGPDRWLGLSTHDEEQFSRGCDRPVDYLALGPIFDSPTKSGHADAVGLEVLRRCCESTDLPVIAIGGLSPERAAAALSAGAAAVAVASALAVGDLESNAAAFRRACALERGLHWVLTGLPGSGKTTVGRELSRLGGRPFVDLDDRVEASWGLSVSEIFETRGEPAFRRAELEALETVLAEPGPAPVVALGGGALTAAGCRRALEGAGARVAWLDAPPSCCAERLSRSPGGRPLLEGAEGDQLVETIARLLQLRRPAYASAALRVDATRPAPDVARDLLEAWSR